MTVHLDRIEAVADSFMEAAVNPDLWVSALEQASEAAGAHGAVLLPVEGRVPGVPSTRSMGEAMEAYFSEGWAVREERERGIPDLFRKGIMVDQEYTSEALRRRSPYYSDFLLRFGLHWSACLGFRVDDQLWCLSLNRRIDQDPYDNEEQRHLLRIASRLTTAATLAHRLDFARLEGISDALEAIGSAALLLDSAGRVIRINRLAERCFDAGLSLTGSRLAATDRASDRRLQILLREALTPDGRIGHAVVERANLRPLVLQAQRLRGLAHAFFSRAAIILLITDPDDRPPGNAAILRDLFGLTAAEAALAAGLLAGATLGEIAASHTVSYETTRSHLKAVLGKTGTHRQGELIALLACLRR